VGAVSGVANIVWLADRLRSTTGLDVRTIDGWQDRGRPASTGTFAPRGVLLHHTAPPGVTVTPGNPHPSLNTVIYGRSDLPGPLCHVLVDRNGVCWIIAAGRANHAGEARASGPMPAGDGNSLYVGIEIEYNPEVQSANEIQKSSACIAAASIVSRLGNGRNYVRAHKETCVPVGRKTDPARFMPMDDARARVGSIIQTSGW
jgi:hypothetical protein